jgi:hypothetical protein
MVYKSSYSRTTVEKTNGDERCGGDAEGQEAHAVEELGKQTKLWIETAKLTVESGL